MLRYTARNGTTFQFETNGDQLYVMPSDEPTAVHVDLSDLREFLGHLEHPEDGPTDADAASVSSD
jgi:hypothetical protein